MPDVDRSGLLTRRSLLAAGAGAALGVVLPDSAPGARAQRLIASRDMAQVEHVVIVMQENISFDHYFGTLRGVRGFSDPDPLTLPSRRPVFEQPDPAAADGYLLPWHLDSTTQNACLILVDNSWDSRHAAVNGGAMDRFVTATGGVPNHYGMAYRTRADVPWHMALADAFTVCDASHCSVLGPTFPNRYMSMTGTIDPEGRGGGPAIDNNPPAAGYTWKTYPERLTAAGVSWRVYHETDDFDDNVLKYFAQYKAAKPGSPLYDNAMVDLPADQLIRDVAADALRQVSWVITNEHDSEHPDGSSAPAYGAAWGDRLFRAFRDHPEVWRKTVVIWTYDEDGGYFDHVRPPLPPPGTASEFVNGLPIGLGLRVPTIICSPWTRGGFVCSHTYDHTSTIRFLERRFGVVEPQISAWRRHICGDMWESFDFASPDYSIPALPSPATAVAQTDVSCQKRAPAPPPATNGLLPVQEPGTRPRRPCSTPTRTMRIKLPRTPVGQKLISASVAVSGRRTRTVTRAELRAGRVLVKDMPVGTTAVVKVTLRRRGRRHRRTAHVKRTLRVACTDRS